MRPMMPILQIRSRKNRRAGKGSPRRHCISTCKRPGANIAPNWRATYSASAITVEWAYSAANPASVARVPFSEAVLRVKNHRAAARAHGRRDQRPGRTEVNHIRVLPGDPMAKAKCVGHETHRVRHGVLLPLAYGPSWITAVSAPASRAASNKRTRSGRGHQSLSIPARERPEANRSNIAGRRPAR